MDHLPPRPAARPLPSLRGTSPRIGAAALLAPVLALALGCGEPPPPPPAAPAPKREVVAPLSVKTTSYPADWLARRLAPSGAMVSLILPAGEDPPHWQPPGALVSSLAEADLIVANGAGFEAWMATAALPESKLVRAADGVPTIAAAATTHSHGPAGAHSHGAVDPHTWGDPQTYALQAEAVAAALIRARPAAETEVKQRLKALKVGLTELDGALAAAWAPLAGVKLAANHPSFAYAARRYGLQLHDLTLDPEAPPPAAAVAAAQAWVDGGGQALLWEAQPRPEVIAALPAGIHHVVLDPLEQPRTEVYDYLGQSRRNIAALDALVVTLKGAPAP